MNTIIKTALAAILFLAVSCKKENNTIQSTSTADKKSTPEFVTNNTAPLASIKIGTQKWMTKNLDVTRYRNGDKIPYVKSHSEWAALKTGAWCWYDNNSANDTIYGKLYNWYAVNDSRGLTPVGWHVPSDTEWTTLSTFLGGDAIAGGKMKETGTTHWSSPNKYATNKSGFTGLPGSDRSLDGSFDNDGLFGLWWSSTQYDTYDAWARKLSNVIGRLDRVYNDAGTGFSVRCLKD